MKPSYIEISDSESSSSSSDEEEILRAKRIRIQEYVECVVHGYSETEFKFHFRMQRTTAYKAISKWGKLLINFCF